MVCSVQNRWRGMVVATLSLSMTGCDTRLVWALSLAAVVAIGIIWLLSKVGAKRANEEARLKKDGVRGLAYVRSVTEANPLGKQRRTLVVDLKLAVRLVSDPDGAPVQADHRCMMPRLMITKVQKGATIPVLVDPDDRATLLIEWDRV